MTELSFLIDLLLDHELQPMTKKAVADRIKVVEEGLTAVPYRATINTPLGTIPGSGLPPHLAKQAPSTLALMAKHGDILAVATPEMPPIEQPVTQVAQTPAAQAAMNSRNAAISQSISGKIDKVTGRPKKW